MAISTARVETKKINLKCTLISTSIKSLPIANAQFPNHPQARDDSHLLGTPVAFPERNTPRALTTQSNLSVLLSTGVIISCIPKSTNRAYHAKYPVNVMIYHKDLKKNSTDLSLKLRTQQMTYKNRILMDVVFFGFGDFFFGGSRRVDQPPSGVLSSPFLFLLVSLSKLSKSGLNRATKTV